MNRFGHTLKTGDVSDSSESLAKNERISWKIRIFPMFLTVFPRFMPKSESLLLLFFKERLERFAPVALYKKATVSDLLRSLMTKERRKRFILLHTKNQRIAQKTLSEFPTLYVGYRYLAFVWDWEENPVNVLIHCMCYFWTYSYNIQYTYLAVQW